MLTNIHSVQWADADGIIINMIGLHPVYGEIPFAARADDIEEHGRDLFARAVAGEFGPVADYAGPSAEMIAAKARKAAIIAALAALDDGSVRALRAKALGTAKAADDARLASVDAQAAALRAELIALGV